MLSTGPVAKYCFEVATSNARFCSILWPKINVCKRRAAIEKDKLDKTLLNYGSLSVLLPHMELGGCDGTHDVGRFLKLLKGNRMKWNTLKLCDKQTNISIRNLVVKIK